MNNLPVKRIQQLEELLDSLQIWCNDLNLLDVALTHSSYTFENKLPSDLNNERLEFLGDAVLKLVASEYLFQRFPEYAEGEMTKIRAILISDNVLSRLAEKIELGKYLKLGYHEAKSGGRQRSSTLACAFEAILGALYLDGRMTDIQDMLLVLLSEEVTNIDQDATKENYKAVLQEFTQGKDGQLPVYEVIKECGPPHDKTFEIAVYIDEIEYGIGVGKSKKEAQQSAAKEALIRLEGENSETTFFTTNKDT
jgi:ribonuclease-3